MSGAKRNSYDFRRTPRNKPVSHENHVISSLIYYLISPCVLEGGVKVHLQRPNLHPGNHLNGFWAAVERVYPYHGIDDGRAWPYAYDSSLYQRL